jgi:hypothetical protein
MKVLSETAEMVFTNLLVEDIQETVHCHRVADLFHYRDLLGDAFSAMDEVGIKRADIFNLISPRTRKKLRRMLSKIDEHKEL